MKVSKQGLKHVAGAFFLGVGGALSFPFVTPLTGEVPALDFLPRELLIFLPICYLFFLHRQNHSWRQTGLLAWSCGLGYFLTLVFWIDFAMVFYGGIPHLLAVPLVALLSAYCALFFSVIVWLSAWISRRWPIPEPVGFASAVVVAEWLRSFLLSGFPWGLWGYSQSRNLPILHLASIGGVYFVSWVLALVGGMAVGVFMARRTHDVRKLGYALISTMVLAYCVGWVRMSDPEPENQGPKIKVGVIQGNIDQEIKNRPSNHRKKIFETYHRLSREAAGEGAELLVWPEAAWPGLLPRNIDQIKGFDLGAAALLGADIYRDAEPEAEFYNAAIFVHPDGKVNGFYAKQHPVPFGEYVPLRWLLPVGKFVPNIADLTPGQSSDPVGPYKLGVLICYDGIFPEIAREEVRKGAEILVNLTNDAWYRVSSAPYQHRDFYAFRAVETDRWVVRAANTGLSVFVDPHGRFQKQTRLYQETISLHEVSRRTSVTPYVRFGNWIIVGSVGIFAAAALTKIAARRKKART